MRLSGVLPDRTLTESQLPGLNVDKAIGTVLPSLAEIVVACGGGTAPPCCAEKLNVAGSEVKYTCVVVKFPVWLAPRFWNERLGGTKVYPDRLGVIV